MNQIGEIIEVNGARATVKFARTKACGQCNACVRFGNDEAVVEMENSIYAQVGDRVEIVLHARSLVSASLILYGVPLLALLLGVALGSLMGDLWAAGLGVSFALAAFLIIRLLEPRFDRMSEFKPRMLRVIEKSSTWRNQQ